jgi:hypothetical protein
LAPTQGSSWTSPSESIQRQKPRRAEARRLSEAGGEAGGLLGLKEGDEGLAIYLRDIDAGADVPLEAREVAFVSLTVWGERFLVA